MRRVNHCLRDEYARLFALAMQRQSAFGMLGHRVFPDNRARPSNAANRTALTAAVCLS
jgi:hypothetical protein